MQQLEAEREASRALLKPLLRMVTRLARHRQRIFFAIEWPAFSPVWLEPTVRSLRSFLPYTALLQGCGFGLRALGGEKGLVRKTWRVVTNLSMLAEDLPRLCTADHDHQIEVPPARLSDLCSDELAAQIFRSACRADFDQEQKLVLVAPVGRTGS